MAAIEDIEREAISLPKDQRLELARKLISSVEEIGDVDDADWESEISRRMEEYRDGKTETISAAVVFDRLEELAPNP